MNRSDPVVTEVPDERFGEEIIRGGGALVKTTTEYTTAIQVQKPRNRKNIEMQLITEAEFSGELFYYTWNVKNKRTGKLETVEGPGIELAACGARLWGNCVWSATYVEDDEHYFLEGHFVDLETGFNVARPFRQRKSIPRGTMDADRAQDIAFQIGVSKAMRNVVIRSLPKALVDHAMEAAKQSVVKRFADAFKDKPKWEALLKKVFARFAKLKVEQTLLEKTHGPVKTWTPAIMAELSSMAQALQDGYSIDEVFGLETGVSSETGSTDAEEAFWAQSKLRKKADKEAMAMYLAEIANSASQTVGQVMTAALEGMENFMAEYEKYQKAGEGKAEGTAPEAEKEEDATPGGEKEAEKFEDEPPLIGEPEDKITEVEAIAIVIGEEIESIPEHPTDVAKALSDCGKITAELARKSEILDPEDHKRLTKELGEKFRKIGELARKQKR